MKESKQMIHAGEAPERLMSKADVASVCRISRRTVDRMVAKKLLIPIRILGAVRFRFSDVMRIIQGGVA